MAGYSRSLVRAAALFTLTLLLWLHANVFELRKTAYSCRTIRSCLGMRAHHTPFQEANHLDEVEGVTSTLHDGTIRFERKSVTANPDVLWLVLNKDASSWSGDFRSAQRTAYDLVDLITATGLNMSATSIALMTSSTDEFEKIKVATSSVPFARTTIFLHHDDSPGFAYKDRHKPAVQLQRRSVIATLRNRLMLSALQDERHVIWLDADVVELSDNIVQTMIRHSNSNEQAGIITALCQQNKIYNYDKNAWRVNSNVSTLMGPVADASRDSAMNELAVTRLVVDELIEDTDDDALLPLDAVGGTLLYMRSHLVREGVTFPHFNIVGTTWTQPGWTGVETEGLCYAARGLKGGGCYVLGGKHHTRHTDWG